MMNLDNDLDDSKSERIKSFFDPKSDKISNQYGFLKQHRIERQLLV